MKCALRWNWKVAILIGVVICLVVAFLAIFPGRQGCIALELATGIGIPSEQMRIDELESKAIRREAFSAEDKAFLRDLYTCLAKGAKLTYVLRQSGQMMDRYLSCTGKALPTVPRIFVKNSRVTEKCRELRSQCLADLKKGQTPREEYATEEFYMPHPSSPDSVFGLYYGRVLLRPLVTGKEEVKLNWRAEVPWVWPSYESLQRKYADYHAECFPLPNPRALVLGRDYALRLDNGLGEYLVQLGLAKPFVVFSEWSETVTTADKGKFGEGTK